MPGTPSILVAYEVRRGRTDGEEEDLRGKEVKT
jgi:hypothetical protein